MEALAALPEPSAEEDDDDDEKDDEEEESLSACAKRCSDSGDEPLPDANDEDVLPDFSYPMSLRRSGATK